mmetsp:Transcript_118636/g.236299  ORF Transcript_118636/g.236299 Transcript_118636/m.236299 type:complete len:242 (+) Transcript_118636:147-872(+)
MHQRHTVQAIAENTMTAACAPGSVTPFQTLSGTFSERPAKGGINFVASAPCTAAVLAAARPPPATRASAAGTKASNIVRLPFPAPPASIMACKPLMNALAPLSDQLFLPEASRKVAMPMNMMLRSTPLDPPIARPVRLERQRQVAAGSASGNFSIASNTFPPADAMVEPQSASPTLPSSSSNSCFESIRALHTLVISCLTASSWEAVMLFMMSSILQTFAGTDDTGARAPGQARTAVGATR